MDKQEIDGNIFLNPICSGTSRKTRLLRYPVPACGKPGKKMHCPGCQAEAFHTLEEAARAHNRDPGGLVDELNRELFSNKASGNGDPSKDPRVL